MTVSPDLLHRLISFSTPRRFTDQSTQFDMGYEQCKRDLRALVVAKSEMARHMIEEARHEQTEIETHTRTKDTAWQSARRWLMT